MNNVLAVLGFLVSGTGAHWKVGPDAYADAPFDAVIVPGCPSEADGRVAACQWERAAWAAALVRGGSVRDVILTGGAVYTPYVEAEALAAAMLALGVSADRIHVEPLARHTDENAGFALGVAEALGFERLAVASVPVHAVLMDEMMLRWGVDIVAIPLDRKVVREVLAAPRPAITTAPVPGWVPFEVREAEEAASGASRGSSIRRYLRHAMAPDGTYAPPRAPVVVR
ncbi:MAG: ElyC/SanA/YdcF family protein [Myxococcota bacterium]